MKQHWSCMAFVRGKAKPGCHSKIRAGAFDYKVLRKAGWRPVYTGNKRIFYKCPACSSL